MCYDAVVVSLCQDSHDLSSLLPLPMVLYVSVGPHLSGDQQHAELQAAIQDSADQLGRV